MARHTGPVCKLCRREGIKLFLKGDRCYTPKCAIDRRATVPGQHGQQRKKASDYAIHLREKQKVRRVYGVLERQFRRYVSRATRERGVTGEALMQFLERRLDNVIFRLGFAGSRAEARQLVNHGHFAINGEKLDIPSYLVRPGDVVTVREKSRQSPRFQELAENAAGRGVPPWLDVDRGSSAARVLRFPTREEIDVQINESLVVEHYSR